MSAVLSKYMVPSSNFFEELRGSGLVLPTSYGEPCEFSSKLNEAARLLMLKSLYSDSLPSHIVPISHFYDHFVRSSFDLVVDVSKTSNGFKTLHGKLSSHIKKQVGVDLPPFPRLNNSPVSSNISLLNKETVEKALCYFEKDYDAFQFTVPDISNWRYQEIDKRELQFFNTFIGVASDFTRSISSPVTLIET